MKQWAGRERRSDANTGCGDRGGDAGGWSGMDGVGSDPRGRYPREVHGLRVADHPPVHGLDELGEHPWIQRPPIAIYPIAIDVSALVSGAPVGVRIFSTN